MSAERYICIHGHFYQPPRENPTLETIEVQDSAYPFHDWNQRITAESYAPNAASRILDGAGRIEKIINNYARISFNFGPTLLSWMEHAEPEAYAAILASDRESQARFSGHGSAIAQGYGHIIMPLSNKRDKWTQVHWGIRDFQHRFGRMPEGMWLPETAVDLESLDIMAEQGIKFTILAPYQVRRVREIGTTEWHDVDGGRVDPSMGYLVRLPSQREITVFPYDGPISSAVAFEKLLDRGEYLANRLMTGFSHLREWPQLVHIATDGETYGHHHRHGDMALAYALDFIEQQGMARLTNYGEYLERHPPTHEAEIIENTSWSCFHGVERWRSNCGCHSGGYPGWTQAWRAPLRDALDWLRDTLAPLYVEHAGTLLKEPWAARNDYISLILDRSPESLAAFFARHATRQLNREETTRALKLLEIQRHAMLMYTSCGWFFDEISGVETLQVVQYAGHAIQLAQELFDDSLEEGFLERLEQARSNVPEFRNGRYLYETRVKPALVNLEQVAAHYAISTLFEEYGDATSLFCYSVRREDYRLLPMGRSRLALGRAVVTSNITRESMRFSFGALHLGDHYVSGGIRRYRGDDAYAELTSTVSASFLRADVAEVIRLIDRNFGTGTYSLKLLFKDEQRKVVNLILDATLDQAFTVYHQLYQERAPLMRFISDLGIPLPRGLHMAAEFTLNTLLRQAVEEDELDVQGITALLEEARSAGVTLDAAGVGLAFQRTIERMIARFRDQPDDVALLQRLHAVVELARATPLQIDFWKIQNIYYAMLEHSDTAPRPHQNDSDLLLTLGEKLGFRMVPV